MEEEWKEKNSKCVASNITEHENLQIQKQHQILEDCLLYQIEKMKKEA